jgi:thiol:disulfide interchange protein
MIADFTDGDAKSKSLLRSVGCNSIPVLAIWIPRKKDPIILPDILTANVVLDALDKARNP